MDFFEVKPSTVSKTGKALTFKVVRFGKLYADGFSKQRDAIKWIVDRLGIGEAL